jgi:hypothetical protein
MFDVRSLGMGIFASSTLLLAAPAWPEGCNTDPIGGTGGTGGTGGLIGSGRVVQPVCY